MSVEELLQQLRDIQPPPEPSWWQLAPAQLLLLGCLALLAGIGWLLLRRRRAHRLARLAGLELHRIEADYRCHGDQRLLAIQLSRWLKQVALLAYPGEHLQGLNGEAWLEFLDQSLGERRFSRGCGRVFGSAVYRPRVNLDAGQVCALCGQWLQAVRPRLRQPGRAT